MTDRYATTKIIRRQLVDRQKLEEARAARRAPGRVYRVEADGTLRRVR